MPRIPRLDAFQRRHRVIGFPIAVFYKFFDDQGSYLTALIAYYGLLSLFPLLLLLSTGLGVVLRGNPDLQQQIVDSALSQVPVIGRDLQTPDQISGSPTSFVVGAVGAIYGGLGVAQAIQNAMNTAWSVPRNSRPNPFKVRGKSIVLLLIIALQVVLTTALTSLDRSGTLSDVISGTFSSVVVLLLTALVSAAIFALIFRFSAAVDLGWRDVLPGAVLAAIAWLALQHFGAVYIQHVVSDAGETSGTFALVLGLIAFLYLIGLTVVLATEVNVVHARRLHPRSLLTPFTDAVVLTPADERQYTEAAQAQRNKGFERIEVEFDDPDEVAAREDAPPER